MTDDLPLVKTGLNLLVDKLRDQDQVGIVVYAGAAGEVLTPTSGRNKPTIINSINSLQAGGSTNGAQGITLAYDRAKSSFIREGNNRVILITDGDFNVGLSSEDELIRLIEKERESGVYLSVIGVGSGNYQDARMESLADKGNGNFAYIDSAREAMRALANEFGGALYTIANDVKIQIEFNPEYVQAYKLLGYENRSLAKEDFNNDKVDAGELGAGQTVTALYVIIPNGVKANLPDVDALRYQNRPAAADSATRSEELALIKLRYKPQNSTDSLKREVPVISAVQKPSTDSLFAAAVAQFGLLLRQDPNLGSASFDNVLALVQQNKGADRSGYRSQFQGLVEQAKALSSSNQTTNRH